MKENLINNNTGTDKKSNIKINKEIKSSKSSIISSNSIETLEIKESPYRYIKLDYFIFKTLYLIF